MTTSAKKKTTTKTTRKKKTAAGAGGSRTSPTNGNGSRRRAVDENLRRASDPSIDRRLPPDLREAAEALVTMPAADHTLRRRSAHREQIVALKKYIMHSFTVNNASASAVFNTLRTKTKLKFSRRFVSDFINLWSGEISETGLERIAGELFRADYDEAQLKEALKAYGAEDQAERVGQLLRQRPRR